MKLIAPLLKRFAVPTTAPSKMTDQTANLPHTAVPSNTLPSLDTARLASRRITKDLSVT